MAIKRTIWNSEVDTSDEAIQRVIDENAELGISLTRNEAVEVLCKENSIFLDDERQNLDISTKNPILVIANLGLWNGRRLGYKVLKEQNMKAIFDTTCGDYQHFFADAYNVQCDDIHHDGTNHYLYRELIGSEEECEPLLDAIYENKNPGLIKNLIRRYSRSLVPYAAEVYGWPVAGRRKAVV